MKWVPDVAKLKSCFNSRFVTLSWEVYSIVFNHFNYICVFQDCFEKHGNSFDGVSK